MLLIQGLLVLGWTQVVAGCLGSTGGGTVEPPNGGATTTLPPASTLPPITTKSPDDLLKEQQQREIDAIPCQFVSCSFEGGSLCLYESAGAPAMPKDLYDWAIKQPRLEEFMNGQQPVVPIGGHDVAILPFTDAYPDLPDVDPFQGAAGPNLGGLGGGVQPAVPRRDPLGDVDGTSINDDHTNVDQAKLAAARGSLFPLSTFFLNQRAKREDILYPHYDINHTPTRSPVALTGPQSVPGLVPVAAIVPDKARGGNKAWLAWRDRFGNRVTGVPHAANDDWYAGAYLLPGERAVMDAEFLFTERRDFTYQAYEATTSLHLQVCCDSLSTCNPVTELPATQADRSWREAHAACPQGTSKIFFVCTNTGPLQGACALDNISVDQEACYPVQGKHATPEELVTKFAKPYLGRRKTNV